MALDCAGVMFLGECIAYDPSKPGVTYFSIGDAVAALSLMLLIPQFLKPIYEFRLRVRRFGREWLYGLTAVGFLLVVIAAILPLVMIGRDSMLTWPLVWEVAAALCFGAAYCVLGLAYLLPAKVWKHSVERFARASVSFLAKAHDQDQVDYVADLSRNIGVLASAGSFVASLPRKRTAFFEFAKRNSIREGELSIALLNVMSDPSFCSTLVHKTPVEAAYQLRELAQRKASVGQSFVRQIARQAIISPNAMLAREIGYTGFRNAPILSQSLFGSSHLNRAFQPLSGLAYDDFDKIDADLIDRLRSAGKVSLETDLRSGAMDAYNMFALARHYETVARNVVRIARKPDSDYNLVISLERSVHDFIEITRNWLGGLETEERRNFYAYADRSFDHNVVEAVAELTFEVLAAIANDFQGFDDRFWPLSLGVFEAIYPRYHDTPNGMDPLQQRVAIKIAKKLDHNMSGYYPSLSRVLIAVIGHYNSDTSHTPNASAYAIIRDVTYSKLKNLKSLSQSNAEKVADFLPNNVRYEAETSDLIHTYRGGGEKRTNLDSLDIPSIELTSDAIWLDSSTTLEFKDVMNNT